MYQHPYRRHPYVLPDPPPDYVGPRWAAPGPPRPLPANKRGWLGCLLGIFLALLLTCRVGPRRRDKLRLFALMAETRRVLAGEAAPSCRTARRPRNKGTKVPACRARSRP